MTIDPMNSRINEAPSQANRLLPTASLPPASAGEKPASSPADSARALSEDERLRQACRDFESIFVGYMLKKMRDAVPEGGLFENNNVESIYKEQLDTEYAKTISESGALGLSQLLFEQLAGESTPVGDDNEAGNAASRVNNG